MPLLLRRHYPDPLAVRGLLAALLAMRNPLLFS